MLPKPSDRPFACFELVFLIVFVETLPGIVLPVGLPGSPLLLLGPKVYEEPLLVPALGGGFLGVLRVGLAGCVGRFGRFHFAEKMKYIFNT